MVQQFTVILLEDIVQGLKNEVCACRDISTRRKQQIACCLIELHSMLCVFLRIESKTLNQQKDDSTLYCDTRFIVVVVGSLEPILQYL